MGRFRLSRSPAAPQALAHMAQMDAMVVSLKPPTTMSSLRRALPMASSSHMNAGAWSHYTGGVMSSAACGPMGADYQDHCVMAVGFNSTAPTPYWIVRNSWSSTWGEQGYIYLEMAENTCGLADDATIPTVKLDQTVAEVAESANRREAMYQRAAQFATKAIVV